MTRFLFKITVEINHCTKIIGLHLRSNNIMIKIFLSSFLIITIGHGCAQTPQKTEDKEQKIEVKADIKQKEIILNFELKDYLSENQDLTNEVLRNRIK